MGSVSPRTLYVYLSLTRVNVTNFSRRVTDIIVTEHKRILSYAGGQRPSRIVHYQYAVFQQPKRILCDSIQPIAFENRLDMCGEQQLAVI